MEKKSFKIGIWFNIFIAVLLIAMIGTLCWYVYTNRGLDNEPANGEVLNNLEQESDEANNGDEDQTWSWIVEPKFEYGEINYANGKYLTYVDNKQKLVNINTCEPYDVGEHDLTEWFHSSTALYDEKNNILGFFYDEVQGIIVSSFKEMFKKDNFLYEPDIINLLENGEGVFAVLSVEFLNPEKVKEGDWTSYDYDYNTDKYALANKSGLTTDFIFDYFKYPCTPTPAIKVEEKWGFINSDGNFIIEPTFEDAVNIDDETAFVKVDGKWGIISKYNKENNKSIINFLSKISEGFHYSKYKLYEDNYDRKSEIEAYKDMQILDEEDMLIFALFVNDEIWAETWNDESNIRIDASKDDVVIEAFVTGEGQKFLPENYISEIIEKYFGKKNINYLNLDLEKIMVGGAGYNVTKRAFQRYTELGESIGDIYKFVKLEKLDSENNYALYFDVYSGYDLSEKLYLECKYEYTFFKDFFKTVNSGIFDIYIKDVEKRRLEKLLLKQMVEEDNRYVIVGRQMIP